MSEAIKECNSVKELDDAIIMLRRKMDNTCYPEMIPFYQEQIKQLEERKQQLMGKLKIGDVAYFKQEKKKVKVVAVGANVYYVKSRGTATPEKVHADLLRKL